MEIMIQPDFVDCRANSRITAALFGSLSCGFLFFYMVDLVNATLEKVTNKA